MKLEEDCLECREPLLTRRVRNGKRQHQAPLEIRRLLVAFLAVEGASSSLFYATLKAGAKIVFTG